MILNQVVNIGTNRIKLLDIEFIEKLREDLARELSKYEGNEKIY